MSKRETPRHKYVVSFELWLRDTASGEVQMHVCVSK
jgi:hypothetical protein